jgi:peptide/nickel transport system ATP-binding protein
MAPLPSPFPPSPPHPLTPSPLLAVEDLTVEFRTRSGVVKALEAVSFALQPGETVGIVGESGSGKSVTAFTLMGVLDRAGKVTAGRPSFRPIASPLTCSKNRNRRYDNCAARNCR